MHVLKLNALLLKLDFMLTPIISLRSCHVWLLVQHVWELERMIVLLVLEAMEEFWRLKFGFLLLYSVINAHLVTLDAGLAILGVYALQPCLLITLPH
jgi:hypothetical protein